MCRLEDPAFNRVLLVPQVLRHKKLAVITIQISQPQKSGSPGSEQHHNPSRERYRRRGHLSTWLKAVLGLQRGCPSSSGFPLCPGAEREEKAPQSQRGNCRRH